jgi:hypothetical protein
MNKIKSGQATPEEIQAAWAIKDFDAYRQRHGSAATDEAGVP